MNEKSLPEQWQEQSGEMVSFTVDDDVSMRILEHIGSETAVEEIKYHVYVFEEFREHRRDRALKGDYNRDVSDGLQCCTDLLKWFCVVHRDTTALLKSYQSTYGVDIDYGTFQRQVEAMKTLLEMVVPFVKKTRAHKRR